MQVLAKQFLSVTIFSLFSVMLHAQCPFPSMGFGSGTAPTPGNSVIIETCNFVGEYETVTGVQAGNTYTVNYSGGNGVHVVIYDGMNNSVAWADTTVQFTAAQTGVYYSVVFMDSLCNASDPNFTCNASLWTNTTSTAELQSVHSSTLSAVPNPTKDVVTISFEGNSGNILISDLLGKMVYSGEVKSGDEIDLGSFNTGIYFAYVQIDGRSEIVQIVHE